MATATYDIALIKAADPISDNFNKSFAALGRDTYGYKIIEVDSTREAALYNPELTIRFRTSKDIDYDVRGYSIKTKSYSDLVICFMQALEDIELPKLSQPGYTEDTALDVDIDVSVGYTSNTAENLILNTDVPAFIKALKKAIDEPTKYIKAYTNLTLTKDPDFKLGLNTEDPSMMLVCGKGEILDGEIQGKPVKYLHMVKDSGGTMPYRWLVPYTTDEPDYEHILMFVARVPKTESANQKLTIYVGSQPLEVEVSSHDFMYFKLTFLPRQYEFHKDHIPFSLMVAPPKNHCKELSFGLNVRSYPIRLDDEMPFNLTVNSHSNVVFCLGKEGSVDIAGVWVSKKGVLDVLDDPVEKYTPYPNEYDPYKSVGGSGIKTDSSSKLPTNSGQWATSDSNSSVAGGVGKTSTKGSTSSNSGNWASSGGTSNILSKSKSSSISGIQSALESSVAFLENAETAIQKYSGTLSTVIKGLDSLNSGKVKFLNTAGIKIDYGPLESALGDINNTFEKRTAIHKMITKMKSLDRSLASYKSIDAASIVTVATKAGILNKEYVAKGITKLGTDFNSITKSISAAETNAAAVVAQAEKVSMGLDSKVGNALSTLNKIGASSAASQLTKLLGNSVSNPFTGSNKVIAALNKQLNTSTNGLGKVKATSAEINRQLNTIAKNLNINLMSPVGKATLANLGQWNQGLRAINGGNAAAGQPGVDYSRYWSNTGATPPGDYSGTDYPSSGGNTPLAGVGSSGGVKLLSSLKAGDLTDLIIH